MARRQGSGKADSSADAESKSPINRGEEMMFYRMVFIAIALFGGFLGFIVVASRHLLTYIF